MDGTQAAGGLCACCMGYTHYWYRPKEIPEDIFRKIVEDFQRVLSQLGEAGVRLAGPLGDGEPIITPDGVVFNGSRNCGHPPKGLVVPWPAENAGGVYPETDVTAGLWFAGTVVAGRTCNGDCSYESFDFPRVYEPYRGEVPGVGGRYFNFCKTGFRPYDLAVTVFLLIAKHWLGDELIVKTDGTDANWFDAKLLCAMELGYGLSYKIDDEGKLVKSV